ncbi:Rrt15p [Saccharomyces cerevisiae S288C]|uniref:Regulator of rDNA transcription protein 15 n=1 Tax=Saccharomyces cerevisiae (strain ATCC 204508 / S288c) TaxID=559292 RepID=RRT15_YEAST|eukprot:NP_878128.1 Rrt15p [Saccharomyces cerevisiae S288C]
MVCIHTENQNQGDFYPFVLLEISVLHESPLGHLRYRLTDVPPQPNSPGEIYCFYINCIMNRR